MGYTVAMSNYGMSLGSRMFSLTSLGAAEKNDVGMWVMRLAQRCSEKSRFTPVLPRGESVEVQRKESLHADDALGESVEV